MKLTKVGFIVFAVVILVQTVFSQTIKMNLMGKFEEGWEKDWIERALVYEETHWEVKTEDDTNRVLKADSEGAASGLWRMLNVQPGRSGKIYWKWKVDRIFSDEINEKSKTGDDYAARVYVVFEPHFVSWKTRAICYVWATNLEVGTTFGSPYSQSVVYIVVQSGKENKGKWINEERNFVADYKKVFNKNPEMITGVAIMVDTENSNELAESWFDDIRIEVTEPVSETDRTIIPGIRNQR